MIRNARLANVFSLEYEQADVAVARGIIVGVGTGYVGTETVDAAGKVLMPGMIDGHVHVESTMLTPRRFAEAVALRGTAARCPQVRDDRRTAHLQLGFSHHHVPGL